MQCIRGACLQPPLHGRAAFVCLLRVFSLPGGSNFKQLPCVFVDRIITNHLSVYFNTMQAPLTPHPTPQKAEGGGGANAAQCIEQTAGAEKACWLHHFVPFKSAEASVC